MLKGCKHYGNKTIKRYENGGYVEGEDSVADASAAAPRARMSVRRLSAGNNPSAQNQARGTYTEPSSSSSSGNQARATPQEAEDDSAVAVASRKQYGSD